MFFFLFLVENVKRADEREGISILSSGPLGAGGDAEGCSAHGQKRNCVIRLQSLSLSNVGFSVVASTLNYIVSGIMSLFSLSGESLHAAWIHC